MKSEDLVAIVDFLYYGEANIYHANLDNFLNIVEELQLKGLNIEKEYDDEVDNSLPIQITPSTVVMDDRHLNQSTVETMTGAQEPSVDYQPYHKSKVEFDMAATKKEFSGNIQKN